MIKLPNGDRYEGDWEDDEKNGEGTLYYRDGGKYEGQWVDDMRNGHGTNTWAAGDRYEGDWKNNRKHGQGKLFYANGGKYVGEWENNMRNGHGENTWPNGMRYIGSWMNNQRHGSGTLTYPDGGKYDGNWSKNMRDGYGVNTWSNGDRYEGSWKRNRRHGQGTLYRADGTEEAGTWINGELDGKPRDETRNDNAKTNLGKVIPKNRVQFKGFWFNGKPFIVVLLSKSSTCPYLSLAREFRDSLEWDKTFFDGEHDRCYCDYCYKERWKDVIEAGEDKYVIPRGWVRLGLHLDRVVVKTQDIWNKWIVTFHGTTKIAAQSILSSRQFCLPGDKLIDGTLLGIRPGHIPDKKFVYTSPTIAYSSHPAYSPTYDFHSAENDACFEAQIVLQCRQMPGSFTIGPETIGAGKTEICPHIPNSKIEYFTDRRATIHAYGLLVRFRSKDTWR